MLWLLACADKTPADTHHVDTELAPMDSAAPADSPVDSATDSSWETGDSGDSARGSGGDTAEVDTSGCDVLVPDDRPTVQNAIYEADGGETICVRAGTWTGGLDLQKKSLDFVGLAGPSKTFVEGDAGGLALWVHYGETASFTGFTFRYGAAVVMVEDSTLTLSDCVVRDGYCDEYYGCAGQGVSANRSTLTLQDVEVRENAASSSAYSNQAAGIALIASTATFTDVLVAGNQAIGDGYYGTTRGVGLLVSDSELDVTRLRVVDNAATAHEAYGVGVAVLNGSLTGTNVVIAGNGLDATDPIGAGLYTSNAEVSLGQAVFSANGPVGANASGSAFAASGGRVTVHNTSLEDHTTGGPVWSDDAELEGSYTNVWSSSGAEVPDGEGNLSTEPLYVDTSPKLAEHWDLRLDPASGLVDAGDPSLTDLDGSRSDIGAYGGAEAWP